ncbi:BTAD domain-containing putative transcriptional regulator [Jannaschia sp. CCS1]|uniref:BTAD domain-containing putative transcriptional regulator n=1 Tax=Jannaschia sp. (strain CCS1) TaxID=290400 RepID=UPI0002F8215A|nr:BTAD domain-containing putative transcriptional regulator [Jannaschia sp. CCS1]
MGNPVTPRGQKPAALLAYLLYNAGRDVPRDRLIDMFWNDRGSKQGRDSLRQALHVLRSTIGEAGAVLMHIDRQSVHVVKAHLSSDLQQKEDAPWELDGEFLADLAPTAPVFEDWLTETRRAVRRHQVAAAEQALDRLDAEANPDAVLACATAILSLDPHHEPAARCAMERYAVQGKRGHALRVFETLSEALKSDGFEVSPDTDNLLRAISDNRFPIDKPHPAPTPRPGASGDARGLPVVWLDLSETRHDRDSWDFVSDFCDHLILRCVQMPEFNLLTVEDVTDIEKYTVAVSSGTTQSGLRISLRLRAPDDHLLWSGRADLPDQPDDDRVHLAVDKLVMQMLPPLEAHVFASLGAQIDTAYGYYLKAKRTFWTDPQFGYIDKVVADLQRAIEIAPTFLPPYPMMIMYHNTGMFMSRPGIDHTDGRAQALDLSQRLLFLNSNFPNAHISMGWCLLWRRNFDAAERSIRRAIELDPYEPHRLSVIGTALVYLGHHEEGQRFYDKAQGRMQHDFDFQRTDYGELHFFKTEYERALSWMEIPEARTPYKTLFFRAAANAQLSRRTDAQNDIDAFVEDIRPRWAGRDPFTPERGFQWYADMLPLRLASDRATLRAAMGKLGLDVTVHEPS